MTIENPLIRCVGRAMQFIQTELNNDRAPKLKDIASASGLSKYHFHRVYKLLTGETCQQTVTRLRLAKGASTLQDPMATITDAAFKAGYGSSQAFAKALKRELSETASELKSDPERLASKVHSLVGSAVPNQEAQQIDLPATQIEVCSLEPLEVILIQTTDKYPILAETYGQLVDAVGDADNIRAILGIPHRDIETYQQDNFVFDCALLPNSHPVKTRPPLKSVSITGGNYLLIRHIGEDAELPNTLDKLYSAALMQSNILLSDTPCIYHYLDDPEEVVESLCRTHIYLKFDIIK